MRYTALLAVVAALLPGVLAARSCAAVGTTATSGNFVLRLLELRYDGPDPTKNNNISTIAVALGTATTPLHECVAQWPESWAGWYEGGNSLIWSECIFTGAGGSPDKVISFAADWKTKTVYVSHIFACSDKPGYDNIAAGSLKLDVSCTTQDDGTYCFPKASETGARPDLRINTKIGTAPDASASCAQSSKLYQSWRVEKWFRQFEMTPGSTSPWDDKPHPKDTGPSFVLRALSNNQTFTCATAGNNKGVFEGKCTADNAATKATTSFTFDSKLNFLKVSQKLECGDS